VGAVFCLEASRLARNGRDWHHLLELCGLVGTRVVDSDGIYDIHDPYLGDCDSELVFEAAPGDAITYGRVQVSWEMMFKSGSLQGNAFTVFSDSQAAGRSGD
jgi:hypothetical protein